MHSQNLQKDPQLEARIKSFEMAYRMQIEATDAFDIAKEPQSIRALYGDTPQGRQLLIARRLVERGVRFVQVWAGGWDHHQDIEDRLPASAAEIDTPAAALLTDLKQRGLLDSTLVIWGGEFGRTVTRDRNGNDNPGRDHNNKAFSIWLAGGGVKGGTVYGATDRVRRDGRRGQSSHSRPARDDSASARLRPHEADLSLQRPRFPAHGQFRRSREGNPGMTARSRAVDIGPWLSGVSLRSVASRSAFPR